jgi:hypothetical protein
MSGGILNSETSARKNMAKRKKKWKVVMVVSDEWSREAGYLDAEAVVAAIKESLDLPPSIKLLSIGAREASKV